MTAKKEPNLTQRIDAYIRKIAISKLPADATEKQIKKQIKTEIDEASQAYLNAQENKKGL